MREVLSGSNSGRPAATAAMIRAAISSGADSPPAVMRGLLTGAPLPSVAAAPMPVRMKDGQTPVTPTPAP